MIKRNKGFEFKLLGLDINIDLTMMKIFKKIV